MVASPVILAARLQDQVAETISDIKQAGVKLWVLTGDKMETAIAIGHSCSILSDATYNAIVDGTSPEAVREQLHQYMSYIVAAQLASEAFEQIALRSVNAPQQGASLFPCLHRASVHIHKSRYLGRSVGMQQCYHLTRADTPCKRALRGLLEQPCGDTLRGREQAEAEASESLTVLGHGLPSAPLS